MSVGINFKGLLMFTFVLLLISVGCSSNGVQQDGETNEGVTKNFTLGTSSQGGSYYVWGGAWSKIMNDNVSNSNIAVEITGGPSTNLQLIQSGEMELGFTTAWLAGEAYDGVGWADKKHDKIRSLFPMYASLLHVNTLEDKSVNSITDLEGKHLTTGMPGGTGEAATGKLVDILKLEDVKVSQMPVDAAAGNLKDGLSDANSGAFGIPAPFLLDMETSHDVSLVGFNQEEMEKLLEAVPYWSAGVIPAGSYSFHNEDINTIAFWNYAVASKDLSEDFVYNLVKTTYEEVDGLLATVSSAQEEDFNKIEEINIPLHPGALKYYKEEGIQIPENLIPPENK
ncbi:TAXI family TRAP transporter solute-binding subunit [Virgibacillus byunsanensis]|uniref:TAXI family TRAP transporter solute-binding subunit n=1 Tax=Virgibacillus byunsanensis TaxID=570945 RepID=A0ABW3LKQ0_9BACI